MARIVFFALLFSTLAHAQAVDGIFKVVKGNVQVQESSTGQIVKAKIGQRVYPKDTVITATDSRAKVVMVDGNIINIMPDTKFSIRAYQYQPNQNKKNVLLNVSYGKIRATVQQKYVGTNKFQVETPSAVAGVRGTDFITSYNSSNNTSSVITFRGRVEFGSPGANGQIANAVFVSAGQMSQMSGFKPPSPPAQMPKSFLAQMDNQSKADTKAPRAPANAAPQSQTPPTTGRNDHREPASVVTQTPNSSMLLPGDLPTVNGPAPMALPANVLPPPSVPFMPPPSNNFVHNVLMNSATKKVNVNVTVPSTGL